MRDSPITVPRYEPEVIAAAARPWRGDTEKVATTALQGLQFRGVGLCSRYGKAGELEVMATMVESVAPELRPKIDTILCDSKAQACYLVELKACSRGEAEEIAHQLARRANEIHASHNGIQVNGAAGGEIFINPGCDY